MSEQQTPKTDAALSIGDGFDPRTPYAQLSIVECALCGERSEAAEHAEQGSWDVDHAHEKHPDVSMLPLVVWTISRARGKTYVGKPKQQPTSQEEQR